jgi:hypothetical protein
MSKRALRSPSVYHLLWRHLGCSRVPSAKAESRERYLASVYEHVTEVAFEADSPCCSQVSILNTVHTSVIRRYCHYHIYHQYEVHKLSRSPCTTPRSMMLFQKVQMKTDILNVPFAGYLSQTSASTFEDSYKGQPFFLTSLVCTTKLVQMCNKTVAIM